MKRIICGLLAFCLLLPALAFAAPSQKLQAIYDSVDTLNVAARTPCHAARVSCHISKSAEYAKSRPFYATSGFLIHAVFYAVSGFGLSIISTFPSAR